MNKTQEQIDDERIDAIMKKIYSYVDSATHSSILKNGSVLNDAWFMRRDLVLEARTKRVLVREELKEDLVWLVEQIEVMTRQGAGSSSPSMNMARNAIKMIVEIL